LCLHEVQGVYLDKVTVTDYAFRESSSGTASSDLAFKETVS